jgi:hypothetical protein
VKLHIVHKEKPMKELMGRERETAQEKGKKHPPKAARGLGDALGAREDDLIIVGDETISLGLGEILPLEIRRHPAGQCIGSVALPHLVFCARVLTRIYELRVGAVQELRSAQGLQQWWRRQKRGTGK